ncbi:MAG TPA: pitrilysin family protein [Polyangiaceae bacterium]|nr:pitrilysin family protein [Polyangiaceae bacterium]
MSIWRPGSLTLAASLLLGCQPSKTASPPSAPGFERAPDAELVQQESAPTTEPPPPGVTPAAPFPTIHHRELGNGLEVRVVERHNLPIVDLNLIVMSGQASDSKPGVAVLAGELLKAGGAGKWDAERLVERAESLGATLSVLTERDATTISIAVTTHNLDAALELLAAVAQKPRFAPQEFTKLKQREIERVSSLAKDSPEWAASMVLYRELYELPTGVHPYASYDATAAAIGEISLGDCRTWYGTHFTPPNAVLVAAGDVTPEDFAKRAEAAFGAWKGEPPPAQSFPAAHVPERLEILLVDRPASTQSLVYVSAFGPERRSAAWPALRATHQILGGGVAGRLFLDVRERRSLAYRTGSSLVEVAHGRVPMLLQAGTQTEKAPEAVAALLEHVGLLKKAAPEAAETEIATRYLADSFLIQLETVGALASLTGRLRVLGLPDDYYDRYREQVRQVSPQDVSAIGREYFDPERVVVVVAGDADRLGKPLSHFGPVTVVSPARAFVIERKLPHDPSQKIEVPPLPAKP